MGAGAVSVAPDGPYNGAARTHLTRDFGAFARAVMSPAPPPSSTWRPWISRLAPGEFDRFNALCRERHITLIDTIDRQLLGLAAVRLPSTLKDAEKWHFFIEDTVAAHGGRASYGNWVYLPWEAKIAPLLDQDAYFEVIANPNLDTITHDEQQLL